MIKSCGEVSAARKHIDRHCMNDYTDPPPVVVLESESENTGETLPTDKPVGGTVTEQIDWWSLEYENLSDELVCPICKTAFVDPVTTKCGHTFCQECIKSTKNSALLFTCPVDRKPIAGEIERSPYLVSGLVNDLVAKCPFSSRGCTFKDKRWLLTNHVESHCQYVRVLCSPPCDKLVQRRHYTEDQCSHVVVECPNKCGITLVQTDLDSHISLSCPKQLVQCPDCHVEQLRENAQGHALSCEMAVLKCTGELAGCKWQGLRRDVGNGEEHIVSCPLAVVAPIIANQNRRIDALETENSTLKTLVELLRRQVRDIPQQDMHFIMEYERVRNELDRVLSITENHVKQLMMIGRENVRITEDLAFLRNGLTTMRHQMHYLNMAQRRSMFPMGTFVPPSQMDRSDRSDRPDRPERSSDGPRHDIKL